MNEYRKKVKRDKIKLVIIQLSLLITLVFGWEILVRIGILNEFLVSKPSSIMKLFITYWNEGHLLSHIKISVYETLLGLFIGTSLGIVIAIGLWWNKFIAKVLDPFLVVLNALPKTALAPILIIWVGLGIKGIVVVAISLSLVVTIMSSLNYFQSVDEEKVKMLKTFGANKFQILTKLILPANLPNLINILKINIGMSWVGVIVGEFLVSREGIGYLVVYGGQVFRLDLVMMGVIILAVIALIMYLCVSLLEKYFIRRIR